MRRSAPGTGCRMRWIRPRCGGPSATGLVKRAGHLGGPRPMSTLLPVSTARSRLGRTGLTPAQASGPNRGSVGRPRRGQHLSPRPAPRAESETQAPTPTRGSSTASRAVTPWIATRTAPPVHRTPRDKSTMNQCHAGSAADPGRRTCGVWWLVPGMQGPGTVPVAVSRDPVCRYVPWPPVFCGWCGEQWGWVSASCPRRCPG